MNIALFLIPVLIIACLVVFRGRLPDVARSLHHAQREYRRDARRAAEEREAAPR